MDVVLYKTEDGKLLLEIQPDGETARLNQRQMAELFDKNTDTIGLHIRNVFGELDRMWSQYITRWQWKNSPQDMGYRPNGFVSRCQLFPGMWAIDLAILRNSDPYATEVSCTLHFGVLILSGIGKNIPMWAWQEAKWSDLLLKTSKKSSLNWPLKIMRFKGISHSKLTAVLVEAVKELKAENDRQKSENKRQQTGIEALRVLF
jgi:hypothetical protein